jgi:hypothetical protein
MTSDRFRQLALTLPDSIESSHMEHPDFRTAGKVFATLGYPRDGWAMVVLAPEEQAVVTAAYPEVFVPAKGAWGRNGSTTIRLEDAPEDAVRKALADAHHRAASRKKGKR